MYRNFKRPFRPPFSASGRVPMDLWVVNDTIRRSKMRDVAGASVLRGARIRERFGPSGECRPREAVRSWSGTGREGVAVWDQAIWTRSSDRADDRGGAPAGKPRWVRILAITEGCSMATMIFKGPPQWGQCSISILNTRLSSGA